MTSTDLNDRLARLSPEKRALLERRLGGIPRREDTFPLSAMQQRLWFLDQLQPHNPAYVIPAAVRIEGDLDPAVLRAVVAEIVRRHESLRTTFATRDGRPVQVVARPGPLDLPEENLGPADPTALAAEIGPRMASHLAEPFDLATGPLLRLRLLHLGRHEHVLLVAMHHIISDGWSLAILVSELAHLYDAFAAGRPSSLPDLPVQYGDFAAWERRPDRGAHPADINHWRDRLAGAPPMLGLPTDRPRPPVQTYAGASVPVDLPAPLMRQLATVAQRHGATTFMALLAAFQVLLHRHSNSDDIVVGVPLANRSRKEVEPLIGFFVNTLPVRVDLSGDPSLLDVLARVREACVATYSHQGVTFDQLVEQLRPDRDLSRPPIFGVSFSYQSAPLPTFEVAGLRLSRLSLPSTTARYDLELQCFDDDGGLSGWFEYNRDLFDEPTVAGMVHQFGLLVQAMATGPDQVADRVALVDDGERRDSRERGPDREWPGRGLIHQCVRAQAERTPDAPALRFEGTRLDYFTVDRRANQLAHRLRSMGVGRDVLVGVCMQRCPELVIALLAILKAGGAYVPLDPGYPAARLEFMLRDSGITTVLTHRPVLDRVPLTPADALCVDELGAELSAQPSTDPDVDVDGDDLAYVIYTSGSTGRPKGAMNVHAAIRNRLLWMQDQFGLGGTDVVLQKTPMSFDVSVWEFFWPLMTGACLVLARPDGHRDSRYLIDTIRSERVTTVHFVPSMLRILLREPDVEACTGLRRVICSGEALPRDLQEEFFHRSPAELHNLYGPTEAAVDVTHWACRRDGDARPVPIGLPIANTQIHVLDRFLQPVPVGVPGELCIAGRNLARGYLNRPELTADRFVAHPLDPAPGARVYRTGDLARYRADGALEYLGRLDHQVKLRGLRIELGEIEAALADHPDVAAAIVTAHEHLDGDTRLIAYTSGDRDPGTAALIAHLTQRLPDYMVPAAFVHMPSFPLSPNGKVDRMALPAPPSARPELATPYEAPRDQLERSIGGAWARVLGLPQVGINDNFFELGGHSLLMIELRDVIQTLVDRQLSMVELFQYPTVASLAGYLNRPVDAHTETLAAAARERAHSRREFLAGRQAAAAARRLTTVDGGQTL
jgi:amino acid adenylation domain-containing protein